MITLAGRRFAPQPLATLITIVSLAILVSLGSWQLRRLDWKVDLIARIDARVDGAPAPLPHRIDLADDWDYRRVTVAGRLDHDASVTLYPRHYRGQVGYHLLTPLIRADGPPVIVDRGWVPQADDPAIDRPDGKLTVEGIARVPPPKAPFQPDNQPDRAAFYWVDLPALADLAGVERVAPVLVEAVDTNGTGDPAYPVGGRTRVDIPNNHLNYALTWFSFAVVLTTIYVIAHLQPLTADGDNGSDSDGRGNAGA